MTVRVEEGDSREVLRTLDADLIDACVTDPPYALVSIANRFGKTSVDDATQTSERARGRSDPYARAATGFMGKKWDVGDVAHDPAFWAEIYRVLKPGAHLAAFGGTRTYHRMVCAIEDAGFEVRDQLAWLYGSGFPKSHDVSKGIDRAAGVEHEKIRLDASEVGNFKGRQDTRPFIEAAQVKGFHEIDGNVPVTAAAATWTGWGTALKPAFEPIVLARKPLSEGTVAANVLRWGTGAINVDGCRIETNGEIFHAPQSDPANRAGVVGMAMQARGDAKRNHTAQRESIERTRHLGRWPANVVYDGSDEVLDAFPDSDDEGSAARFFFSAKADVNDRWHSKHPTVKPVSLITWLVKLVVPPGGVFLDPFAGSGTAGAAALETGRDAILIEREAEYVADIMERLAAYRGESGLPTPRRSSRRGDAGSLFDVFGEG